MKEAGEVLGNDAQTAAGGLWREARGRLEDVRELVDGLRERLVGTFTRVRGVAEQPLDGLAETLRGAGNTIISQ